MRIAFIVVVTVGLGAAAAPLAGAAWWHRGTVEKIAQLEAAIVPAGAFDAAAIAALPPPAARYFHRVLKTGAPMVRSVTATQEAVFFVNNGWRPQTATQRFSTSAPGFVWDATIAMMPLMPVYVRDAYVAGRGSMHVTLLGLHTLVDQSGAPELDAGALQRFLGEAVWFPTALLPSKHVTWTPRDDVSATVTLADGAARVSLHFQFNGDGDVTTMSGDRYKESNGAYTLQPWVITCGDHAERGGMRIPLQCEVAWLGPGGPEPYWRGRIAAIQYEFAP